MEHDKVKVKETLTPEQQAARRAQIEAFRRQYGGCLALRAA
jgi:hypothetical protein